MLKKFITNVKIIRRTFLSVTESNGIRNIKLQDHKTRNSLSYLMMEELIDAIKKKEDDKTLRVIVLSADGSIFSAGHNLKELSTDKGYDNQKKVFDKCHDLMKTIIQSQVPIISKVDGLAAAAGLQLVASTDIAICSEKSTFSTPGASFGIFCSTPGIALARTIPRMMSCKMLLTGLPINAQEALRIGLVSVVVPSESVDSETDKICDAIKSKSRSVVTFGRKFFYEQLEMNLNSAYIHGSKAMTNNLQMIDGKEGITSFIEKRKPKWTNE